MKKILLVLCFISVAFCTTGCNLYFKVKQNDVLYYGAYNARDMIHADVKLYQQNSDVFCDGVVFLNSPSRAITLKNDLVLLNHFIISSISLKLSITYVEFKSSKNFLPLKPYAQPIKSRFEFFAVR